MKYLCRYKDGSKKRQKSLRASNRAMAIIGLFSVGIFCKNIISLDAIRKQKSI